MVVAHIGANGLSLETGRWGKAQGEGRGFRQQPRGTLITVYLPSVSLHDTCDSVEQI